jgi:glycogen debranching enzyme
MVPNAFCKLGTLSMTNQNRLSLRRSLASIFLVFLAGIALAQSQPATASSGERLVITRAARPWEFMPAVGRRAAILGRESGTIEGWVYPMKLFRDFNLVFHVGDREIPAATLVRSIEVHPESVTLRYSGDTFTVKETFFAPPDEMGAIVALEVTAYQPLEIEARFRRDFQLMWPAALGATYANWNEPAHAFTFGEETKKWFGIVGSPTASTPTSDFDTNSSSGDVSSFRLTPFGKGTERQVIAFAGSVKSQDELLSTYGRLTMQYDSLLSAAKKQYADYLDNTASLELPDAELQRAYDWSRVSVLQGMVTNPFLGAGLVAGYRTSGTSARPGFAWFFGRDSEWTSFALNSAGDFADAKTALEFLTRVQRQDGRIPHEIAQTANQVPWFTDYPFPWASADATPLFIVAVRDYYENSGDAEFVTAHWENLWRAYQFLRSTWDEQGIPKNVGVGHGWIEGGPLLPVKSEFYQSGLGAESLNALSTLARVAGKQDVAAEMAATFKQRQTQLNELFWNPEGKYFAFAIDQQDKRVDVPTVLTTVPMWFGETDSAKSDANITQLADADHATDWGMRILSTKDPRFDPSGYHFGSVWPLFTGWAAVAEYRYHRANPAYENLRANALLALAQSAGHTTEVLSGSFFETLSTGSPHQIWSAAMVVSPMLRGMLGIDASASAKRLTVAPHLPGDWNWWKARGIRIGSSTVDLAYRNDAGTITFEVRPRNGGGYTLEFSPGLSPNATVQHVEVNGRTAKFDVRRSPEDQHVVVSVPLSDNSTVRIATKNDFALALSPALPELGAPSRNLKVVSETWSSDFRSVIYELAGIAGRTYEVGFRGTVPGADGAELLRQPGTMRVKFPAGEPGYTHTRFTLHLPR